MIIESLLDTDLYKLTMMQAVFHQFPKNAGVEYIFKCRNEADWRVYILNRIKDEVEHFCTLGFKSEEIKYLKSIPFLKKDFIDFLTFYRPYRNDIDIYLENKELKIKIKGNWLHTILFEVPILAIINEVYFENEYPSGGAKNLSHKLQMIHGIEDFKFSDFGTRRRYSRIWQQMAIETAIATLPNNFIGTSNVMFAKDFNIKPIGTMAHEWLQAGQGICKNIFNFQRNMLYNWLREYPTDLDIALTDVIGIDAFLRDFDEELTKSYSGVRHDSGDPIEWGEKIISHYKSMNIDPQIKTLVFSDGLTFQKAIKILDHFRGRTKIVFGIGTNFTNDFDDITPLQIVIKMIKCNNMPVAKISDSPGKRMCEDKAYLDYLKEIFKIGENK